MTADTVSIVLGFLQSAVASNVFVLVLIVGFCVLLNVFKQKRTAGQAMVIKSLDERIDHKPEQYLSPKAPHGPADQLRAPELVEAKA